ncbi:MAG: DUF3857 domain-containing protein [Planctomycetota bacterium]|nr:DUF3857 domain-containing protein [Planctomycetota bacterium]
MSVPGLRFPPGLRGLLCVAVFVGVAASWSGEAPVLPPQAYHALGGAAPDPATKAAFDALLAGKLKEAEDAFRGQVEKQAGDAAARFGLGLCERLQGRAQEALVCFAEAFTQGRQDPWAEVYLHLLEETLRLARDERPFLLACLAAEKDPATPPHLLSLARSLRADWLAERGRFDEAVAAAAPLQFLKSWAVIGPFDNRDGAGMAADYEPEHEVQFERPIQGRNRKVAWRPLPGQAYDGRVDCAGLFEPNTHSIVYAVTHIQVEQPQWAVLWLGCGGCAKVWLNERQVLEVNEANDYADEKAAAPVYLHQGSNQVLVKLGVVEETDWAFSLRLSNPAGGPLAGVSEGASPEALKAYLATRTGRAPPLLEPANPDLGLRSKLDLALKAEPDSAWLLGWSGYLEAKRQAGTKEEHRPAQTYAKALARAPNSPLFLILQAEYPGDPNVRRQAGEACLAAHPGLPAALHVLARLAFEAGVEQEAERYARALWAGPGAERAGEASWLLARILHDRGFDAEAHRHAARFVAQRPYEPAGWMTLALLELGRAARRKTLRQGLEACGGSVELRSAWADELVTMEQYGEAAAVREGSLALLPFDIPERLAAAEAWRRAGQPEKAHALLEQTRDVAPENTDLLAAMAGMRLHEGKNEDAVALYREVLRIKPNAPQVKDLLAELSVGAGIDRGFFERYDIALKDLPDPKPEAYPDDNAVYMLRQEVVHVNPNGTSSRMFHQVAKLLRSGGKGELQRHQIYYDPQRQVVDILRASVITPAGRELARADVNDRSVSAAMGVQTKIYDEYHLKEVVFRDLEVGATVDLQYVVRDTGENIYGDYFADLFYVGDDSPTVRSQYILNLPKTREFQHRAFRGDVPLERLESPNPEREVLKWEAQNLKGIVQERRMPPLPDELTFVQTTTMRTWQEVGAWYWNLAKDQVVADDAMRATVKELTDGKASDTEKLRAIHDWVIEKIRYLGIEFGRNGYKPHRATETFQALYGDCKDTATLITAMLKEAGIESRLVLVRTVDAGKVDADTLPSPNLFNHCIAYVPDVDGKPYWIDCTTDYHQLGEIPWADQGAQVLVAGPDGGRFVQIPRSEAGESLTETRITASVAAEGGAKVFLRTVSTGQYAPYWRQRAATPGQFRQFLKEQLARSYPGAELTNLSHPPAGEQGAMWFEVEVQVPRITRRSGDRFSLPIVSEPEELSRNYVTGTERRHDLMLWFPRARRYEVVYQLDPAYKVAALPEPVERKEAFGSFTREVRQDGQSVSVKIAYSLNSHRITKDEYPAFVDFCRRVDGWMDEKILLQK